MLLMAENKKSRQLLWSGQRSITLGAKRIFNISRTRLELERERMEPTPSYDALRQRIQLCTEPRASVYKAVGGLTYVYSWLYKSKMDPGLNPTNLRLRTGTSTIRQFDSNE